jgi:hypothetical protein
VPYLVVHESQQIDEEMWEATRGDTFFTIISMPGRTMRLEEDDTDGIQYNNGSRWGGPHSLVIALTPSTCSSVGHVLHWRPGSQKADTYSVQDISILRYTKDSRDNGARVTDRGSSLSSVGAGVKDYNGKARRALASICDVLFDSDDNERYSFEPPAHVLQQQLCLDTDDAEEPTLEWNLTLTSKDPDDTSATIEKHCATLELMKMDASNAAAAAAKAKREKDAADRAAIDAKYKEEHGAAAEERRIYRRARSLYHQKLEDAYESGNQEVIERAFAEWMPYLLEDPTDPVVVRQEIAKFKALFARSIDERAPAGEAKLTDADLDRLEAEVAESARRRAQAKIDAAGAAVSTAQAKAEGGALSAAAKGAALDAANDPALASPALAAALDSHAAAAALDAIGWSPLDTIDEASIPADAAAAIGWIPLDTIVAIPADAGAAPIEAAAGPADAGAAPTHALIPLPDAGAAPTYALGATAAAFRIGQPRGRLSTTGKGGDKAAVVTPVNVLLISSSSGTVVRVDLTLLQPDEEGDIAPDAIACTLDTGVAVPCHGRYDPATKKLRIDAALSEQENYAWLWAEIEVWRASDADANASIDASAGAMDIDIV